MSEGKELAKSLLDAAVEHAGKSGASGATFIGIAGSLQVNSTAITTVVTDITPEAARAQIETARMIHAVPAQEVTKQEIERTKQARQPTWRVGICVVGLALGFVTMIIRPEVAKEVAIAVGVLAGGFGGAEIVSRWKAATATPALPPKDSGSP